MMYNVYRSYQTYVTIKLVFFQIKKSLFFGVEDKVQDYARKSYFLEELDGSFGLLNKTIVSWIL